MFEKSKNNERACMFYASDYHFEMISLPYINECLKMKKKVVIITERDLRGTVEKVLERINMDEIEKQKILEVNWEKDNFNEIYNLEKGAVIFVKGEEKYIDNIMKEIEKLENKEIDIINCYDINKLGEEAKNIADKYNKVLSTKGMIEV